VALSLSCPVRTPGRQPKRVFRRYPCGNQEIQVALSLNQVWDYLFIDLFCRFPIVGSHAVWRRIRSKPEEGSDLAASGCCIWLELCTTNVKRFTCTLILNNCCLSTRLQESFSMMNSNMIDRRSKGSPIKVTDDYDEF
jgi:hypothetical protein